MFKTLTAAVAALTLTTAVAPGAQAFGFGDALGIANTVINTVEAIENNNRPSARQSVSQSRPQVQQEQQSTAAQRAETMAALCSVESAGPSAYALELQGWGSCTEEQDAAHDRGREAARQYNVQCQAALGESAYWNGSSCRSGRPSVGYLRGPGTSGNSPR